MSTFDRRGRPRAAAWAMAAAMGLVMAGCTVAGGAGSPGASAPDLSPTPTATPAWTTFTSDRYGYAMDHPTDWKVRQTAGEAFVPGMRPRSAGTDTFESPDARRYGGDDGLVVIAALALEDGETPDDFSLRAATATPCGKGVGRDPGVLDGEPALSRYFTCGAHDWLQYTAIRGERGYIVWFVTTQPPGPDDRPINEALLASFRFTE